MAKILTKMQKPIDNKNFNRTIGKKKAKRNFKGGQKTNYRGEY